MTKLEAVLEAFNGSCDTVYDLLNDVRVKLLAQQEEHKKVAQKKEVLAFVGELQLAKDPANPLDPTEADTELANSLSDLDGIAQDPLASLQILKSC